MQPSHRQSRNGNKVVYLPNKKRSYQRSMAQVKLNEKVSASTRRGQTLAVVLVGLVGMGLAAVPLVQAYSQQQQLQQDLQVVKAEEKAAMQENIQAQEVYKQMQDPEFLADVARRDYYYSKPGEIIFNIEDSQE